MSGLSEHIPVLQTEHLTLRAPSPEDFDAYAAFMTSDRSHVAGVGMRQVWHLFATEFFGWILQGFGHWVIERDGRAIGVTGFSQPAYYPEPEMGWALYDGRDEGQGYAFEAAQAARDWARGRLCSLVSYTTAANLRSAAVAGRLGAALDPRAPRPEGAGEDLRIYRHWGQP